MDYKAKTDFFIDLMEEKKLTEIYAVDITDLTSEANTFIIATAANERQAKAVTEFILEEAEKKDFIPLGIEGKDKARWILMDFTDVIIHIFCEEERIFYNLERLWADAKVIKE